MVSSPTLVAALEFSSDVSHPHNELGMALLTLLK